MLQVNCELCLKMTFLMGNSSKYHYFPRTLGSHSALKLARKISRSNIRNDLLSERGGGVANSMQPYVDRFRGESFEARRRGMEIG